MKTQRPITSDDDHRVIQFRPRTAPLAARRGSGVVQPLRAEPAPEPLDLSRYEQPREEPDDFRHRMLANIAALAFTIALIAVGIWLAVSIADLRRTQDCVLMGRRDCVRITTPHI
jgi:cytochrome c-type biogenesis protein CcmH/NrfG